MPISVVFDPPLPSDSPSTFNTKAFTLLGDLNDWSTQANALPGEFASDVAATLAAPPAIGSTTPAAGSFTTLSATNGASPDTAPSLVVQGAASNQGGVQFGSSSVGYRIVGGLAYAGVDIVAGGVTAGHFSSSGLAVTGTLSATGDFSTIGGSGYKYIRFHSASDSNSVRTAKIGKNYDSPWDLDIHASTGTSGSGNETAIKFYKNNTDVVATIDSSGNLTLSAGTLGYGTGAGGTVTQATSKSTAVTLNKSSGQITMNNAALAAGATVTFTFYNSMMGTADSMLIQANAGTNQTRKYTVEHGLGAGGAYVHVTNVSASALSEAVVLNFAIIKVATS